MLRTALLHRIKTIALQNFEELALLVFNHQANHNPLYKEYLALLHCKPQNISRLDEIPFLPIELFKKYSIKTENWDAQQVFTSSGTTGQTPSQHLVRELAVYEYTCRQIFQKFYGATKEFCFLALLPSYLEREGSSLVYMVNQFIQDSNYPESGFFLNNQAQLMTQLQKCQNQKIPTVLIGVSFALWDLAKKYPSDLSRIIIMETGGMKGRAKEITRKELHGILQTAFQVDHIHSEYGMTELLSQAYAKADGVFYPANTMKAMVRQISDPFSQEKFGRTGGLNIIDLANIDTCSFIATDDLAKVYEDGSFEILGRLDTSEIRGCNLMLTDIIA